MRLAQYWNATGMAYCVHTAFENEQQKMLVSFSLQTVTLMKMKGKTILEVYIEWHIQS